jgi:hypothetical protein
MTMWPDDLDDLERNITSSDVEFLTGEEEEKSKAKSSKDKPEGTRASINAKATSDLSGFEHKADIVMDDSDTIMSVH